MPRNLLLEQPTVVIQVGVLVCEIGGLRVLKIVWQKITDLCRAEAEIIRT